MKNFFKNKVIALFTIICGASVLLSACKKSDPVPIVYGDSYIRVVNSISNAADQDVYQNNTKISTAAIAYGSANSDYYTIKGGPNTISVADAGASTANASINANVEENAYFTIFYFADANATPALYGFKDDRTLPPAGKARVRFLNLGFSFNNSINVTYTANGTVIVGNLGNGMSNYNNIDPNTDLGVTIIGSTTTGVIPGSNFVAGKIYTVWFDAISPTTAQFHVVQQN